VHGKETHVVINGAPHYNCNRHNIITHIIYAYHLYIYDTGMCIRTVYTSRWMLYHPACIGTLKERIMHNNGQREYIKVHIAEIKRIVRVRV